MGSDHYPIAIKMVESVVMVGKPNSFNTDATDWGVYCRLTATNGTANDIADVNDLVDHIENSIMAATSAAMPMKRGEYAKPSAPWCTREVAEVRRQRIMAQQALRLTYNIPNKIAYNRLRARCSYVQLHACRNSWEEYISINVLESREIKYERR